eukprot:TRINITY_DN27152_c0_g2_i1.p1 TRINITY_DN27152_c0_g2~~TRINITY_DN27152_c0_g2_i1.p1  ORF type:complete len:624 (-),score=95.57 TRINITY_DN27152_c0_g2_i1:205-2076(-)
MDMHAEQVEETCPICLGSLLTPGQSAMTLSSCNHRFHESCINEMRKHDLPSTCPLCRSESEELTSNECLFRDAIFLKLRGSFEEAFGKLSRVADTEPDHFHAICSLAQSFANGLGVAQDDEHAAALYERAIRLRPDGCDTYVRSRLGEVYKRLGRTREANSLFEQEYANNLHPTALFNLALAAKEAGDLARAEKLYLQCHYQGVLTATLNLGNIYKLSGRTRDAEVMYRHVIADGQLRMMMPGLEDFAGQHEGDVARAMVGMGHIHKDNGNLDEAREMWLRATLLDAFRTPASFKFSSELNALLIDHGCKDMVGKFADLICEGGDTDVIVKKVLKKMSELEKYPDPLRKGSRVELVGLQRTELNKREGVVEGKKADRFQVRLCDDEVVKLVKRSNLLVVSHYYSKLLFSDRSEYVPSQTDYDIHAGIEQSRLQFAEESNARVAASVAASTQPLVNFVIIEYSRPAEWFDQALMEYGSVRVFCGAHFVGDPDLLETLRAELPKQEDNLPFKDVNQLRSRFVITEKRRQESVEKIIDAARTAVGRKEKGSFKKKHAHTLTASSPSFSHQQDLQAGFQPGFLASTSSSSDQQNRQPGDVSIVSRTFIDIPVPTSLRSMSSAHPKTI